MSKENLDFFPPIFLSPLRDVAILWQGDLSLEPFCCCLSYHASESTASSSLPPFSVWVNKGVILGTLPATSGSNQDLYS